MFSDSANSKLRAVENPQPAACWDAGNLGCGELVLELRTRMATIAPGQFFHLVAHDPAAPEDLPAWCRMTGHRLVRVNHPDYLLQRKDS